MRGGFGVFPDRFNDDIVLQHVELPPLVNTPTANYTTIRELLATPLSLSPAQVRTLDPDYKPQYTYNYSIGVQRDLGWKLVGDFSYVGSKGRQLLQTRNLNAVPYGTNFLPSSIDPTTGGALPNVVPAAVSRLRRHPVLGVRRLLELRRAADAGQPPLHGRAALRRRLHVRQDPERRHRLAAQQQPDGEPVPRRSRIATTATPDGGTTWPSTTRTRCRT